MMTFMDFSRLLLVEEMIEVVRVTFNKIYVPVRPLTFPPCPSSSELISEKKESSMQQC